jgi:dihydrofolate synthase/folylpolyglutamate synthase
MLGALRADEFDTVVVCTPPSPRGMPQDEVAAAATRLGCDRVVLGGTVEQACERALGIAEHDDAMLVTGSLYVVGAARPYLRRVR